MIDVVTICSNRDNKDRILLGNNRILYIILYPLNIFLYVDLSFILYIT